VQYHPEYGYRDVAAAALRYGPSLVQERLFTDEPALAQFAADLRTLEATPGEEPLLWKYGLGPAMASDALRLLELRNWLEAEVVPRHARDG
jgi:GMP synthase (glutamine-hydrolysing)